MCAHTVSHNLVEIIRRHHELGAPTALEVLKQALADHGEITDDDRRALLVTIEQRHPTPAA